MNTIAGFLLLLAFIGLLAGCNSAAMNGLDIFIAVVCGLLLVGSALAVWSCWPTVSDDDEVHP